MIESTATRLPPWQADPRCAWSLFDMMRFYGASFTKVILDLEKVRQLLKRESIAPLGDGGQKLRRPVIEKVKNLKGSIVELPVSNSLRGQIDRFLSHASTAPIPELGIRLDEVRHNLISELGDHVFLCIPASDKELFVEPEGYWSQALILAFPDARQDMRQCVQCLALEMWTASVFHAMRAVQHGLRRLADRLGVTFAKDFDALNWNEIIDGIDKKLRDMKQQKKNAATDAEVHFAAGVSSHFFGVKEAWRNYVMHGRSTYDEEQARSIAATVRAIMQALA